MNWALISVGWLEAGMEQELGGGRQFVHKYSTSLINFQLCWASKHGRTKKGQKGNNHGLHWQCNCLNCLILILYCFSDR